MRIALGPIRMEGVAMPSSSKPFVWIASLIAVAALVPIVAATLMVASVIWIPLLVALVATLVALMVRARRHHEAVTAPK
jgi:hypothetical protein